MPHYTYKDYCGWEGQWELIDGIPYAMSPAPRPEHQAVAGNIHAELRSALKQAHCNQCKVYQPIDYKVAEDTVLNPDVLIVCQPITKPFLDFPPELVIEILSPSTELKDRHTKLLIYEQQQVRCYLIIDIPKKEVEVYRLNEDGKYEKQFVNQKEATGFLLSDCIVNVVFDAIWS